MNPAAVALVGTAVALLGLGLRRRTPVVVDAAATLALVLGFARLVRAARGGDAWGDGGGVRRGAGGMYLDTYADCTARPHQQRFRLRGSAFSRPEPSRLDPQSLSPSCRPSFLQALFCRHRRAHAQTEAPPTPLQKQLEKLDLSIQGTGIYNSKVSGTVVSGIGADNQGEPMTQFGSNTLGALVSIHYPAKPYFGLEFNYSFARYTENYEGTGDFDLPAEWHHRLPGADEGE